MASVLTLDDTVVLQWLSSAYGDAKAAEAMCLPWELRVQLYPEVLYWGPNGLRVAALFDAVAALDEDDLSKLLTATRVLFDSAFVDVGQKFVFRHGGDAAFDYLYAQFKLGARRVDEVHVAICTVFVALALTADWFPELAEELTEYEGLVDAFLATAGLPVMHVNGEQAAHVL